MVSAVDVDRVRAIAGSVPDPELPMVTLGDLGIVREVAVTGTGVEVGLTPTYLGCPALAEMRRDVMHRLTAAGFGDVRVRTVLSPPWSSDDITAAGRRKLAAAGIAPPRPAPHRDGPVPLTLTPRHGGGDAAGSPVRCPQCGSADTVRTAAFSATACRALYRCGACAEPFEYVKDI